MKKGNGTKRFPAHLLNKLGHLRAVWMCDRNAFAPLSQETNMMKVLIGGIARDGVLSGDIECETFETTIGDWTKRKTRKVYVVRMFIAPQIVTDAFLKKAKNRLVEITRTTPGTF